MTDFDPKNTTDNFDKEFSLNTKKKTAARGKVPSWIMILAGAAVMAAVAIVQKPTVRTPDNNIRNAAYVTEATSAPANTTTINLNDQKADPSELEARFRAENVKPYEAADASVIYANNDRAYQLQLEAIDPNAGGSASQNTDAFTVWVNDKPYAFSLEPTGEIQDRDAVKSSSATYWIGDQLYSISLQPISSESLKNLSAQEMSSIVRISGQTYQLSVAPYEEEPTAEPKPTEVSAAAPTAAPDDDPFSDESPVQEEQKSAEAPAFAWLDETPYSVNVISDDDTDPQNNASGTAADGDASKQKSVSFEIEGHQYEIRLTEADPSNVPENAPEPILWLGETPLRISLQPDEDKETGDTSSFDIVLDTLPDEERTELQQQKFGDSIIVSEPTSEPAEITVTATAEPEKEGFFVGLYHSIFGGSPTQTPIPQVTVIAITPTAAPVLPTATPVVIRMAQTTEQSGPVRLDGSEDPDENLEAKSLNSTNNYMYDPALIEEDPTAMPTNAVVSAGDDQTHAVTGNGREDSGGSEPQKIEVLIVDPDDPDNFRTKPTAAPTPEELPHTGGAESWNIPSMLAMLAGLLLVIIGVRRLRSNRQ